MRPPYAKLADERCRFGYRRLHALEVRREGVQVNHKLVYRLYSDAGRSVRRRKRQHDVVIERQALILPSAPNRVWSMDFVSDALANGRRIKVLTIFDDFSKEARVKVDRENQPLTMTSHLLDCHTPFCTTVQHQNDTPAGQLGYNTTTSSLNTS